MEIPKASDSVPVENEGPVLGGCTLHSLGERGLVLSLSTFAEDVPGVLLKAFMARGVTTEQLLDGFNAPLGTFSGRIKAAHSLGLIMEEQFEDLERKRFQVISLEEWKLICQ